MQSVNWSEIVLNKQWLEQLERQASRRFVEPVTAEEASTFVLTKLAEDDWARCKTFRGQARPATFLYSLSARLFEEFSRQRYGRARPPQWLQQQGELWVRLWKAVCLERHSTEYVINRQQSHDATIISNIIRAIKARLPWCGATNLPVPEEYLGESESLASDSLEDALSASHLEDTLALLAALLGDQEAFAEVETSQIEQARSALTLDDESLLMLKMHFQDGLNFASIARALNVPKHQPGRQIKQGLIKINQALESAGLHLRSAAQALEDRL
ncbi:hypothetical protein [Litorivivens sp.]|uniref:hypothetical protein n=1 Tax=Litorivivens sp. TaxID=2020868 RepID=UPI003562581F